MEDHTEASLETHNTTNCENDVFAGLVLSVIHHFLLRSFRFVVFMTDLSVSLKAIKLTVALQSHSTVCCFFRFSRV